MKHKTIYALFVLVCFTTNLASQINQKPFVIPELQEWDGAMGQFTLSKRAYITVPKNSPELYKVAETLVADYNLLFGKKLRIKDGAASDGDISIALGNVSLGDEGYTILIDKQVKIEAQTPLAAFWATRTLLQMAEQTKGVELPKGAIKDFPMYGKRGFMIDCGRKYFPIEYLRQCVKIMSYYKMNCFQIHLNDNGFKQYFDNDWSKTYAAFRLESETFPGLAAKDGHYTKKEFIDLQILAEEYGVTIVPEIDAPAHTLAFAHYKPELGSEEYGMDHLDLFNPETYKFMDALWAEYIGGDNPVFRGKAVHIGTDEYSNKKKEVVEKFRYFTDRYIKYVESFGKQAYVWGALTHAKGETPVKSENVVMNAWYNGYADPKEMVGQGYKLISIPDGLLYIVPAAGYYYDYLNTKHLYESWTPAKVGKVEFEDNDPAILGGMFAVWNDHAGNGISVKDVHHRVYPAIQTLAVKMWTGKNTKLPYLVFDTKRHSLSEAPGVNVNAKVGNKLSTFYTEERLKPNRSDCPHNEVGYPYTVEFDIISDTTEVKGTVLFSSQNATFYLSDPETGKVGFSRDGYLITFDYKIPQKRLVRLGIVGDEFSTQLYVNGKLVENLGIEVKTFNDGKDKMKNVRTLVFPLKQTGDFKSRIWNFRASNFYAIRLKE